MLILLFKIYLESGPHPEINECKGPDGDINGASNKMQDSWFN